MPDKNRIDSISDVAPLTVQETQLDQVVVAVSPEAYAEFLARLDMPANPNERLKKTMQNTTLWDKAYNEKLP